MGNTSGKVNNNKVNNNNVPKKPQAKQPDSSVPVTPNEKIELDRLFRGIRSNKPPREIPDCRDVFKNSPNIAPSPVKTTRF
jgi:hypothetical protein